MEAQPLDGNVVFLLGYDASVQAASTFPFNINRHRDEPALNFAITSWQHSTQIYSELALHFAIPSAKLFSLREDALVGLHANFPIQSIVYATSLPGGSIGQRLAVSKLIYRPCPLVFPDDSSEVVLRPSSHIHANPAQCCRVPSPVAADTKLVGSSFRHGWLWWPYIDRVVARRAFLGRFLTSPLRRQVVIITEDKSKAAEELMQLTDSLLTARDELGHVSRLPTS
ncbi:hypothetical protein EVAR_13454_1 [Eumeta japonica]|uniref:Uncharacterized protein n=1 Tax=Eumeta variegata TaxID=151549 RepID=A0A4C1UXZ8_EUMVA|nr:hypothetical protein EVAR_13454_1 [Eumeta japonica]